MIHRLPITLPMLRVKSGKSDWLRVQTNSLRMYTENQTRPGVVIGADQNERSPPGDENSCRVVKSVSQDLKLPTNQGEPSHETWLKSALGLHSMNTIINK